MKTKQQIHPALKKRNSIAQHPNSFTNNLQNHPGQNMVKKIDMKIIYSIDITLGSLLIAGKNGLVIYSLKTQKPVFVLEETVWEAVFIPNSNYVAFVKNSKQQSGQIRKYLHILDISKNKIVSKLKISAQIQYLKASRGCLVLGSLSDLYVLHIPSLQSIYNGPAGNGLQLIFDMSFEGLTLAFNTLTKGQISIRNFTNMEVSKMIIERKKTAMSEQSKKMLSKIRQSTVRKMSSLIQQEQSLERFDIKAHLQAVTQIKLSPNGSRVATASNKGTVIRIFSCAHGEKLEELRVGYELTKILDIQFFIDGNLIGCLTEKGVVQVFNVQMQQYQEAYQNYKQHHKIYQQQNPKSVFSFLSFAAKPLADSYPFNHYKLINPQYKQEMEQIQEARLARQKQGQYEVLIQEVDEQHKDQFIKDQRKFNKRKEKMDQLDKNSNSIASDLQVQIKSQNLQVQDEVLELDDPQMKQKYSMSVQVSNQMQKDQINPLSIIFNANKIITPELKHRQTAPVQPTSVKQKSETRSASTNNLPKIQIGSTLSRDKFKKDQMIKQFLFNSYNSIGKICLTDNNYLWVIKGFYLHGLKYDPFHGGQMYHDKVIKLQ